MTSWTGPLGPRADRPHEPGFTSDMRLCNDSGMVDGEYLDRLNHLRRASGHAPYDGAAFPCTGSAHLAGEHIRCISFAHAAAPVTTGTCLVGAPLNGWQVTTTGNNTVTR